IREYLETTSRNAFVKFAGLINSATSGRRGHLATIALNMAGVTTDKNGISRVYEQHPGVIDRYFEYVDVVALSQKLNVDEAVAKRVSPAIIKGGGFLAAGIIIGVAGVTIYKRKST
ncbi:MAG: hypothetical protein WD529_07285, partial [Balneolaceae bacterium]